MAITLDGTTGITTPGLINTGTTTITDLTTTGNTILGDASTDTLNVSNGGLIKDSSGNVGMGVTPSAWTNKALQIGGTYGYLNFSSTGGGGAVITNAYYNGSSFIYQNTNYAGQFDFGLSTGGAFTYKVAPSGTAGNAATFTEILKLQNVSQANMTVGGTNASILVNSTNGIYPGIFLLTSGTSFAQFAGDGTNAAVGANGYLQFMTNGYGTERARIETTGEFLIGTTSSGASQRLAIVGGATLCMMKNTSATDGTAKTTILFRDNGDNNRGSITVSTSGTVYNTTSDYRLKENIAPMTGALAKVSQLNPVTYKWKETGDSGQGFIAHELAEVVPECVTGEKDAVEQRNGQEFIVPQGIDTSFLVATLTAAIQELKSELDLVKAELATLRG